MRLGKEKASGYVADSITDSRTADEPAIDSAERTPLAPVPAPVAVPELAQPAG